MSGIVSVREAAVLVLALAVTCGVLASGGPQDSIAYKNLDRASVALDRAIAAHGGPKLLARTDDLHLSVKGIYRLEGHMAKPWASKDYPFKQSIVYSATLEALKSESVEDGEKPDSWFAIVGPANGIELAPGRPKPLYPFDDSTHTDEYVLPYLPSHKLIVTGDMVYILRDAEPRPASSRERAIRRVIAENKLDVEGILQTWFLDKSDAVTPYARLEEKLRLETPKQ